jgi:hypothetical protein
VAGVSAGRARRDVPRGPSAVPLPAALCTPDGLTALQRTAGNAAVQRALDAVAQRDGEQAIPLAGGGTGTLAFSKKPGTNANFTFSDATFDDLRATLTARQAAGTEIGSALPSTPAIKINGQDGTGLPDDDVVTNATVTIVENITLPVWTNEGSASVQPEQKAEWTRFKSAVSAHEDLHAADDEGIYKAAAASLPGKTVKGAYDAIDAATTAGNTQGPVRDASNPAPTLNPAGVTKVP